MSTVPVQNFGHSRVILHFDVDCFYAQVEMINNPTLKNKPVGIQQKNLMVTCNYVARSMGLKKSMWIKDALNILPTLVLINGSDLTPYRQCSAEILRVLQSYTKMVEKLGMDENFVDVTDILESYEDDKCFEIIGKVYGINLEEGESFEEPCGCGCFEKLTIGTRIAKKMRQHIFEVTGVETCAGIAHNKLLAKLVSGHNKPNNQTVVFPSQVASVMQSLSSVKDIPGIGSITFKTLESIGIFTVEELQSCSLKKLNQKFDSDFSIRLKKLSQGVDESGLISSGLPQTLSLEDAFKKVSTVEEVSNKFEVLISRLMKLLVDDGRFPSRIRVVVRKYSKEIHFGKRETKQLALPPSLFGYFDKVFVSEELENSLKRIVLNLFHKMVDVSKPFHLTLVGVGFNQFYERASNDRSIVNYFQRTAKKLKKNNELFENERDEEEPSVGIKKHFSTSDLFEHCASTSKESTLLEQSNAKEGLNERATHIKQETLPLQSSSSSPWKLCPSQKDIKSKSKTCQTKVPKNQTKIESFFIRSNSNLDPNSLNSLTEGNNFFGKSVPEMTMGSLLIKKNIDPAVFEELPPNIQQEILTDISREVL